ncbi:MAG: serine hydrolase [Bacteroidota bacterium]
MKTKPNEPLKFFSSSNSYRSLLLCIYYFSLQSLAIGQLSKSDPELNSIRGVLEDYLEGTSKGQITKLKNAFHPDFNLYTVNEVDSLWIRDGEQYLSYFQEGVKNNRVGRILDIDYEKNAATAKVEVVVPGWRVFTDYFLLMKYLGNWKIVQKSYTSIPIKEARQNADLDSLFTAVDRPDHPSVAVVALQNGKIVYKNAFGSSHLTNQVPATTKTRFQLSTMSRQFTAFAILLLEEQGKLSVKDDIRIHLPYLPLYSTPITIDHLLTLTSGLPDVWPLLELQGISDEDVQTQTQAMEIIRSMEPMSPAGEAFTYSHTEQILLAEIIAKVSDKQYAQFMKEEVFEPLEMYEAVIRESGSEYSDLAEYYVPVDSSFQKTSLGLGFVGPINAYASIEDLAKWEQHLLEPQLGSKRLVDKLFTICKTNDGTDIHTLRGAWSYGQQFYHWGHGVPELYQIGYLGGHASAIFKFPEQNFTVITLSSGMEYSGYLGMNLVEHFIGDSLHDEEIDFRNLKTIKLKTRTLESYVGSYWTERACFSRDIKLVNDTLRYIRTDGRENALVPLSKNRFQMIIGGGEQVFITFEKNTFTYKSGEARALEFTRYTPTAPDIRINDYLGAYYNDPLNLVYTLETEDDILYASHPKAGRIQLSHLSNGLYQGNRWYFSSLTMDQEGDGFTVDTEHFKGLHFKRIGK